MILTDSTKWVDLYETIKNETRKSEEKHVQIYVSAADADSVCALRILEVSGGHRHGQATPFYFYFLTAYAIFRSS